MSSIKQKILAFALITAAASGAQAGNNYYIPPFQIANTNLRYTGEFVLTPVSPVTPVGQGTSCSCFSMNMYDAAWAQRVLALTEGYIAGKNVSGTWDSEMDVTGCCHMTEYTF